MGPAEADDPDQQRDLAFQWGVGCLIGAVALIGVFLLSLVIALYVQPPTWVQVALGFLLTGGSVALAWLVAAAVGRARAEQRRVR